MNTITKTLGNVVCTISPAVFISTTHSGKPAEFRSSLDFGETNPLTIEFNRSVIVATFNLVDHIYGVHVTRAYGLQNELVAEVLSVGDPLGNSVNVLVKGSAPIVKLECIPVGLSESSYADLTVTVDPNASLPVTQLPTPQSVEVSAPVIGTVDLRSMIRVNTSLIDRQYTKGTLRAIPSETLAVENISSDFEIQIEFTGGAGVSFSPARFSLAPRSTQTVTVDFDIVQVEQLATGLTTVNAVMNLSSNTGIVVEVPKPPVIERPPIIPWPVPTSVPTPTTPRGPRGPGIINPPIIITDLTPTTPINRPTITPTPVSTPAVPVTPVVSNPGGDGSVPPSPIIFATSQQPAFIEPRPVLPEIETVSDEVPFIDSDGTSVNDELQIERVEPMTLEEFISRFSSFKA